MQLNLIKKSSSVNIDGDVFGELVPIAKDNNDIDLELNLEVLVLAGGARVDLWKQHVRWDLNVVYAVTVCYLDILHLGRGGLSLECLHPHKLDLH